MEVTESLVQGPVESDECFLWGLIILYWQCSNDKMRRRMAPLEQGSFSSHFTSYWRSLPLWSHFLWLPAHPLTYIRKNTYVKIVLMYKNIWVLNHFDLFSMMLSAYLWPSSYQSHSSSSFHLHTHTHTHTHTSVPCFLQSALDISEAEWLEFMKKCGYRTIFLKICSSIGYITML